MILGPTGTGKTELAFELALALGAEIVNCDAVQVYRGLDAATAKPTHEQRSRVPHHLVDCVDPHHDFSLAQFVAAAERAIAGIARRRAPVIVAGGTGLYLRGLLRGIVAAPPRDEPLRRRLHDIARRRGGPALHRLLARLDPASAGRLPVADTQRVARAIEFALLAGEPWSARLREQGSWAGGIERYASLKLGLTLERAELYRRLDLRVARFFEHGLVEEVRALLARGVPREANALKAIGYREVLGALDEGRDPAGTIDEVQRNSRRYAKRQLTWFRREPVVTWLDAAAGTAPLVEQALALWRGTSPAEHD